MKYLLALALLLSLSSCAFINPNTGEEMRGVPVDIVVELSQALAEKVAIYDINKDGFITQDEGIALGLAYGNDIYQAILRYNAENWNSVRTR